MTIFALGYGAGILTTVLTAIAFLVHYTRSPGFGHE